MKTIGTTLLLPGYALVLGTPPDRALLTQFMQCTYQELYPQQSFDHLAKTVEQYFSRETPLWWVVPNASKTAPEAAKAAAAPMQRPVGCLWLGTAIDQLSGDRHAHVFLLYIAPEHRRQGLGTALMRHAETWAIARGDRQISLHVFSKNQPAQALYQTLGYAPVSIWMVKPLQRGDRAP